MIYVNLHYVQKYEELRNGIEESSELWDVRQALFAIDNNNFNISHIQDLIRRMELKFTKEIYELEFIASILSSNRINNSYSRPYNPIDLQY